MLGYEYVNLSPEQVEVRRTLLDQAGTQAYITAIVIVATIAVYRQPSGLSKPQQPSPSSGGILHRLSWILDTTYIGEFGPLRVQLVGLLYAGYLVSRVAFMTGDDYMHVTKAFGHVAVSQLPLHYLLSVKSPRSPLTKFTGLTHERLNAYHRLFGRIIHAMMATHAILYLRFFVDKGLLAKRIQDTDVRLGIMAFWTMNFLGVLAIPPIRAKMYHKVFYRSHIVLSALLLVILWFHVPYTRKYVGQAAALWVFNGILRRNTSSPTTVTCTTVGEDLVRVTAKLKGKNKPFLIGMHVYLNQGGLGPKTPFTVLESRTPAGGDTEIDVIAKNSGGPMTGSFGKAAVDGTKLDLQLEGPYGEAQLYMPELLKQAKSGQGKFLLVAGGVGATYSLPVYRALSNAGATDIELLWVVRKSQDVNWAKDFLKTGDKDNGVRLAITQEKAVEKKGGANDLLSKSKVTFGRPNLGVIVDEFLARGSKEDTKKDAGPITVMVCGPSGLTKALRNAVGKHVLGNGTRVQWYEEQYGFGGS